jgi:hypothetical protein
MTESEITQSVEDYMEVLPNHSGVREVTADNAWYKVTFRDGVYIFLWPSAVEQMTPDAVNELSAASNGLIAPAGPWTAPVITVTEASNLRTTEQVKEVDDRIYRTISLSPLSSNNEAVQVAGRTFIRVLKEYGIEAPATLAPALGGAYRSGSRLLLDNLKDVRDKLATVQRQIISEADDRRAADEAHAAALRDMTSELDRVGVIRQAAADWRNTELTDAQRFEAFTKMTDAVDALNGVSVSA